MPNRTIMAIVPVRVTPSTKHRLSSLFDNGTRRELVIAMLQDVLQAINQATQINKTIIVCNEKLIGPEINHPQCEVLVTNKTDLNQEISIALKHAEQLGASAVIIILADLPLLTGVVLDSIICQGMEKSKLVIAIDWLGQGTNVLFLNVPTKFTIHFGKDSLSAHIKTAKRTGYKFIQFAALETSLDIDNEEAIKRFLNLANLHPRFQNTQTYNRLRSLSLPPARRERE